MKFPCTYSSLSVRMKHPFGVGHSTMWTFFLYCRQHRRTFRVFLISLIRNPLPVVSFLMIVVILSMKFDCSPWPSPTLSSVRERLLSPSWYGKGGFKLDRSELVVNHFADEPLKHFLYSVIGSRDSVVAF